RWPWPSAPRAPLPLPRAAAARPRAPRAPPRRPRTPRLQGRVEGRHSRRPARPPGLHREARCPRSTAPISHGPLPRRARRPRRRARRGRPRPRAPEPSAAAALVRGEGGPARASASLAPSMGLAPATRLRRRGLRLPARGLRRSHARRRVRHQARRRRARPRGPAPASATAADSQSLRRTAEARVRLSSPTGAATHRSVRRAARSCESARPGSESGHLCAMRGFMTPPPGSRLAFRAELATRNPDHGFTQRWTDTHVILTDSSGSPSRLALEGAFVAGTTGELVERTTESDVRKDHWRYDLIGRWLVGHTGLPRPNVAAAGSESLLVFVADA